ncbi:DUF6776 family protein [Parahaliea aestuarii]|uniref:Uncharacterized protein n=1 Tax=Parahaliea aestuarii TaxID=1852021 RepID=A0A5C8ZLL6_9GAMM|nr:DUF6776 family protein [Parahaliea aestuarii]TXS89466.1 hypothetical protein FVW59_18315 [Parahaliea aestuarii]
MLVVVLLLVAAALLGFGALLGQQAAYRGMGIDPDQYREWRRAYPEAQAEIRALQEQVAAARTRHEVDRSALELVRKDLARQQEQIADLDEGLRFYRSLMAPGEIAQGFSLRGVELTALEAPGHYAFRIIAQQEARKHDTLRGALSVTVLGLEQGQPLSYPLSVLSDDVDEEGIGLRFRYFQVVEGELVLPEGFQPQSLDVQATISQPRKLDLRESHPWQVQERFTHVAK